MTRKSVKTSLVRYCPGSAPGPPAWMSQAQAGQQLRRDSGYLGKLVAANAIDLPVQLPHIGGTCPRCEGK